MEIWESIGIADSVYTDLDLPEPDKLNRRAIRNIKKNLLNSDTILSLVDEELARCDTSENTPSEIEEIRHYTIEEVNSRIDRLLDEFYAAQEQATLDVYDQIVGLISNSGIEGIFDVTTDYEPADPSVGIYNEERTIGITLTNGATITLIAEIDTDDI